MTGAATQEQDMGVNVRPAGRDEARPHTNPQAEPRPAVPGAGLALMLVDGHHLFRRAQTATGGAGTGPAPARARWPEVAVWGEALRLTARASLPEDLLTGPAAPELLPAGRLPTEAGRW
ncbi:hypothetical protein [Streptomyces sp. IMTB 1903]|uniref:hypothetical protein n=1 Tax=Streptomyces sp. IMTB 1903 TaxID=1776680 RepID=UPI000754A199|nr:hypothetical protein [Streptomyces sp. IMTB 1903]